MKRKEQFLPFREQYTSLKKQTLDKLSRINELQFELAQLLQELEDVLMEIEEK